MNDTKLHFNRQLCKFQDYVYPPRNEFRQNTVTDFSSSKKVNSSTNNKSLKKASLHKQRLSGTVSKNPNPSRIKKDLPDRLNQTNEALILSPSNLLSNSLTTENTTSTLPSTDGFKLERIYPKHVNIKFDEEKQNISSQSPSSYNKKLLSEANSLFNPKRCNISPSTTSYKVFESVQNRFYIDFLKDIKKKQIEENQMNNCCKVDSLFKVRPIKINRKLDDLSEIAKKIKKKQLRSKNQSERLESIAETAIDKFKVKYGEMIRQETQMLEDFQRENPTITKKHSSQFTMKLSLKTLKKNDMYNSSPSPSNKKLQQNIISRKGSHEQPQIQQSKQESFFLSKQKTLTNSKSNNSTSQQNESSTGFNKVAVPIQNFSTLNINKNFPANINKRDALFEEKFTKYKSTLKLTAQLHQLPLIFPQNYGRNELNFYVSKGNNNPLVKQMLKKRWWLGHCEEKKNLSKNNVIWTQLKDKNYFNNNNNPTTPQMNSEKTVDRTKLPPTIHNHFQQNQFLGNKKALFYSMRAYYTQKNMNVFDYLPLTYHITNTGDDSFKAFLEAFTDNSTWILKPGENSNRGNGITVHQSIESIRAAIEQQKQIEQSKQINQQNDQNNCSDSSTKSTISTADKNRQKESLSPSSSPPPLPPQQQRTFILQKYIQKPFLYNKRKFDIRTYMLLTRLNKTIKAYWYNQGYIRTSCYEYSLNDCTNTYVHLTNDAIQIHCDGYGKFQDGNKLSYAAFQKYLDGQMGGGGSDGGVNMGKGKLDFEGMVLPQLKDIALDSIKATYKRLGEWKQDRPSFEIFGLDFMLDQNFKPWLIEINTNPCLQSSNRVLERIIPSMLDNTFKLTVDLLFPPPLNWSNCYKHLVSKNVDKNGFELIFDQRQYEEEQQFKEEEVCCKGELETGKLRSESGEHSDSGKDDKGVQNQFDALKYMGHIEEDDEVFQDQNNSSGNN